MKDPSNIDDALDEVVKYHESGVTDDSVKEGTGRQPARAAHTNAAENENSDDDEADDDETDIRVAHATKPFNKDKKSNVPQDKPKDSTVVKSETPVATIDQMKSLIEESEKTMKELLIQQANVGNKGGAPGGNKNQGGKNGNKGGPHGPGKHTPSGPCYNCQKYGHFRHDCKNPYVPCSTGQQFQMP